MGMGNFGGRPPQPGGGMPPAGGPPAMGGGAPGGDIRAQLQQLHASLPPEYQRMLDPTNPITVLIYKRLRELDEADGQALLALIGNAEIDQIRAFKKFLPEAELLLDMFDDGEVNGSLGADAEPAAGGGMPSPGAPSSPPPRPPGPPSGGLPEGIEDDEPTPPRRTGLGSIF